MSAVTLIMLYSLFVIGEQILFNNVFKKLSDSNLTLWTDRGAIKVQSKLNCAFQCLYMDSCKAFTYVETTATCTLGLCAQNSTTPRNQTTELYQTQLAKCSASPGFSYWSYGNAKACLWQSAVKRNIATAIADCSAKGAVLLTLKSVDKLHIAQMLNGSYYVGLNDIKTEGTFVFNADNTVLDNNLKTQLFASTQPDDTSGNEDCVTYAESMRGLNDVPCSNQEYYVCEKLCFVP